jgi:uncharacterized phage protein (TIGR01671 family)
MREIKFRAFDKSDGDEESVSRMIYSNDLPYDLSLDFDNNGNIRFSVNYEYCDSFGDDHDNWEEIDNIMQYSGIKDKNGKDIYEGDIVEYESILTSRKQRRLVEYTGKYGFNLKGAYYTPDDKFSCFEVIGNIYENPELLESEV